jgi:tyrosine aminotransferase
METGNDDGQAAAATPWNFAPNDALLGLTALSVRGVLGRVKAGMVNDGARPVVPMGHGDPSAFPCFRTAPEAVDAVANALRSGEHNSYSPCVGLEPARRSDTAPLKKKTFSVLTIFKLYICKISSS